MVVTIIGVMLVVAAGVRLIQRYEHIALVTDCQSLLGERIREETPQDVDEVYWDALVASTGNCFTNCCAFGEDKMSQEWFRSFNRELRRRIENNERDIALLDWIWDQCRDNTKGGQHYNDTFRPRFEEVKRQALKSSHATKRPR